MKKTIKIALALFILATATSFISAKKWYALTVKSAGYKIEFPLQPTESTQVVDSEIGELTLNIQMLDLTSGDAINDNWVYMVNFTKYPKEFVDSDDKSALATLFRSSIDGAVTSVNGKLLSEKKVKLGSYPGREVKIDFQDGLAIIRMRLYLVENKMYILETITETKKDNNKDIAKFMDSFELLK
jgi:hypothetical protein